MSRNELAYTPVKAYKIAGLIFTRASSWNGLEELRDQKGRTLIVAMSPSLAGFAAVFDELFGQGAEPGKLHVISGSPDLMVDLGLVKKESP